MDKAYELKYHDEEAKNWWFVARRDSIVRQLELLGISKKAKILDIGCSGGMLALTLKQHGYTEVYAIDYSEDAVSLTRKRGVEQAYVMDGQRPDFPDDTFDVLIASDCLEHLPNDKMALREWYRILRPGGRAIVYVPAYMWLWSEHDEVNFHFRRYTLSGLKAKSLAAGFQVIRGGYWNFLVFFPTAALRVWQRLWKRPRKSPPKSDQLVRLPGVVNKALIRLVGGENRLLSRVSFPFGVSAYVILKK